MRKERERERDRVVRFEVRVKPQNDSWGITRDDSLRHGIRLEKEEGIFSVVSEELFSFSLSDEVGLIRRLPFI